MTDTNEKLKAFRADLRELLVRYDASLCFNCEGDTHGIQEEEIAVSFGWGGDYSTLANGYSVAASDLKE